MKNYRYYIFCSSASIALFLLTFTSSFAKQIERFHIQLRGTIITAACHAAVDMHEITMPHHSPLLSHIGTTGFIRPINLHISECAGNTAHIKYKGTKHPKNASLLHVRGFDNFNLGLGLQAHYNGTIYHHTQNHSGHRLDPNKRNHEITLHFAYHWADKENKKIPSLSNSNETNRTTVNIHINHK